MDYFPIVLRQYAKDNALSPAFQGHLSNTHLLSDESQVMSDEKKQGFCRGMACPPALFK